MYTNVAVFSMDPFWKPENGAYSSPSQAAYSKGLFMDILQNKLWKISWEYAKLNEVK